MVKDLVEEEVAVAVEEDLEVCRNIAKKNPLLKRELLHISF